MIWRIYVVYGLSGTFKYNFIGDKHKLMELIGCLVSTSIETCHVSYQKVFEIDKSLETIESHIIFDDKIFFKTY